MSPAFCATSRFESSPFSEKNSDSTTGCESDRRHTLWDDDYIGPVAGGWHGIQLASICTVFFNSGEGNLELIDVKSWCLKQLLQSSHEAAERRKAKDGRVSRRKPLEFGIEHITHRLGVTERTARESLARLERMDTVHPVLRANISEAAKRKSTLIPVPRRFLRWAIKQKSLAVIATGFAYAVRCLFTVRNGVKSGGRATVAWISRIFGISASSVSRATTALKVAGFLRAVRSPLQAVIKWGARFIFTVPQRADPAPIPAPVCSVSNTNLTCAYKEEPVTPNGENNHKGENGCLRTRGEAENAPETEPFDVQPCSPALAQPETDINAIIESETPSKSDDAHKPLPEPEPTNIIIQDLLDFGRTVVLFNKFVDRGHFTDNPKTLNDFLTTAVMAVRRRADGAIRDPVKIFAKRIWHWNFKWLSDCDEQTVLRRKSNRERQKPPTWQQKAEHRAMIASRITEMREYGDFEDLMIGVLERIEGYAKVDPRGARRHREWSEQCVVAAKMPLGSKVMLSAEFAEAIVELDDDLNRDMFEKQPVKKRY